MNLLITGGAGFIGSNLCDYFINKNYFVRCLDNFSTGFYQNIKHLINHPNFQLVEADITNLKTCQNACQGIDYVLHQAALGSVPRSINDPKTTNEVNVTGFLNMLIACRDQKIKRLVYAASSSAYGDLATLPKIEENIGKPLSPYAITKYVNELYAEVFNKAYALNTIGLRYFNVFGNRQNPEGEYAAVIPKFILSMINLIPPTIYGDGSNSRDFTYIKDAVLINELALITKKPMAINQVYNTATAQQTSLINLFELLQKKLSNYNPKIKELNPIFAKQRQGDVAHSLANIDKAKKLLNYKPKFTLEHGLNETVDWYYKKYENK